MTSGKKVDDHDNQEYSLCVYTLLTQYLHGILALMHTVQRQLLFTLYIVQINSISIAVDYLQI